MAELQFLRPEWFYAAAALVLLPFLVYMRRRSGGAWRAAADWSLLQAQLVPVRVKKIVFPVVLLGACQIAAIFALAGPAFEKLPQPVLKQGADTVFLTDISVFMTVGDVKPSRMRRAAFKLSDMLKQTRDGQNALILYDNEEFVATPLTSDAKVIESILPTIEAGMMGGQAPKPAKAIDKAAQMFAHAGVKNGNVVMLGAYLDDADLSDALRAARDLKNAGHKLFVIGVGDTAGAPVVLPDGSFLKIGGKPVLSGVSQKAFEALARAGGGSYAKLSADDSDFKAFLNAKNANGAVDPSRFLENQKADVYKDVGYRLVWGILPVAALCFRRGWLAVFVAMIFLSSPSQAFELRDLFVRRDVSAARDLKAGKTVSPDVFKDDSWRGAAAYKAGDYETAVNALSAANAPDDRYNLGNALAHAGKYEEAIAAYKDVLNENPDHADAAFNKKYLEEKLKQQRQNQQQNQSGQNQRQNQSRGGGQSAQNQARDGQNQNGAQNQAQQGQEQSQAQNQMQNGRNQPQNASGNQDGRRADAQKDESRRNGGERDGKNNEKSGKSAGKQENGRDGKPESESAAGKEDKNGDGEKQPPRREWMSDVEDDPSGLLRARIQQKLMQKQENYRRRGGGR